MPNPMGLSDIQFRTLFNKASIHVNNRDGRISATNDEQKYAAGINYINANWRSLYDSLRAQRGQVRNPIHALRRGFLSNKGLRGLDNAPPTIWFVTFDLYNRGANVNDPNGSRRCIAVLENWTIPATATTRSYSSPEGGYFRYLIYSATHYGDNGSPAFQNVAGWPLANRPGGAYGVNTDASLTFD